MHLCCECGEDDQPVATTLNGSYSNLRLCSQEKLLELLRVTAEKEIVSISYAFIWLSNCFIGFSIEKFYCVQLRNTTVNGILIFISP